MLIELLSHDGKGFGNIELSTEMLGATVIVGMIEYDNVRYKVDDCYIHIEEAGNPENGSWVVIVVEEVT